ncbi:MAG: AAA family ATPase [Brockia lithotrophica]|nr:AAA family ATPase [Brockia lithotrophica]
MNHEAQTKVRRESAPAQSRVRSLLVLGRPGSGKTALLLGTALYLRERGIDVRYLKPVGFAFGGEGVDADALLMGRVLGLPEPPSALAPLVLGVHAFPTDVEEFARKVEEMLARAEEAGRTAGSAVLLVDGPGRPHRLAAFGVDSLALGEKLGAHLAYVVRPKDGDDAVDEAVFYLERGRERGLPWAGIVFSAVRPHEESRIEEIYRPILARRGIPVLGSVPYTPALSAPTARVFASVLGGKVYETGPLDRPVEQVLVGAMTPERALSYFRRFSNIAVITGGDRTDLAAAALEADLSLLILSGGIEPDVRVLVRAEERSVPVLLVDEDTYTVARKVEEISRVLSADDGDAVETAKSVVAQTLGKNLEALFGFSPGEGAQDARVSPQE